MIVLVVDNSIAIIERWQCLLEETKNINAVYGAVSFQEATRLLKEVQPGVVLVDGNLSEKGTSYLLKEIKGSGSSATVIVLANLQDEYILREMNSIGADFFFDKYHEFEKAAAKINTIAISANEEMKTVK